MTAPSERNAAFFVPGQKSVFFDCANTKTIEQTVHSHCQWAENDDYRVHYHEGEIGFTPNFVAADALQMLGLAQPETHHRLQVANTCILMRRDGKNFTLDQERRILKCFQCALQPDCGVGGCFLPTSPTDHYCRASGCTALICEACVGKNEHLCSQHERQT
jgi:hypothetical protein